MSPKRILICDDEDDIREVATMSLEMVGGYEVIAANCGADAIAKAAAERPDAILLDVMMPDMDGPTTFKQLQAQEATKGIPVVLMTAKVMSNDLQRFDDLGVQGVIPKPFDPMTLAPQLAATLGWAEG